MEISPRIGYEINFENKSYFNFFPNVKNFKSAKLYQVNDTILFFKIERNAQNNTFFDTLKLNANDYPTMQKIIENNEYVIWDGSHENTLNIPWSPVISKIIQPRMRYSNEWNEIKFELRDKSIVQGNLLWADSSFLIIGPMNLKYDWKNVTNQYKVYHFLEIERFYSPKNREFMGRRDIYLLNLKYLQELSSFQETDEDLEYFMVPELTKLLKMKQAIISKNKNESPQNLDALIKSQLSKFIISMEFLIPTFNQLFFPTISLKGNTRYNDQNPANLGWHLWQKTISDMPLPIINTNMPGFMLEYKLTDNYNIGIGINLFQSEFKYSQEQPSGIDLQGKLIALYLSYTKIFRNSYSFDFFSDFEINYRLGLLYGNFNNSIIINTKNEYNLQPIFKDELKYEHSVYGVMLDIKFSYFITDYFTLDARTYINLLSPVKIDNWKNSDNEDYYLSIEDESFNYSVLGFRLGFGLRI